MKPLLKLVQKEFYLDFRQSSGVASIIVYLFSILFSTSILFKNHFTDTSYSSVYLIIYLFTAILASYRNYTKEDKNSYLFNYIYYSPLHYIFGKILYSVITNLFYALLLLFLFIVFNTTRIENYGLFLITIVGLSIGMGTLLSLMGSISSKTQSNFALISIMSFPLLLPLLLVASKLCMASIQNIPITLTLKYIFTLYLIDVIQLVLAFILFQQVWEE